MSSETNEIGWFEKTEDAIEIFRPITRSNRRLGVIAKNNSNKEPIVVTGVRANIIARGCEVFPCKPSDQSYFFSKPTTDTGYTDHKFSSPIILNPNDTQKIEFPFPLTVGTHAYSNGNKCYRVQFALLTSNSEVTYEGINVAATEFSLASAGRFRCYYVAKEIQFI